MPRDHLTTFTISLTTGEYLRLRRALGLRRPPTLTGLSRIARELLLRACTALERVPLEDDMPPELGSELAFQAHTDQRARAAEGLA